MTLSATAAQNKFSKVLDKAMGVRLPAVIERNAPPRRENDGRLWNAATDDYRSANDALDRPERHPSILSQHKKKGEPTSSP